MKQKKAGKYTALIEGIKKSLCTHKLEYLSILISVVTAVIVFFQTERLAQEANQLTAGQLSDGSDHAAFGKSGGDRGPI